MRWLGTLIALLITVIAIFMGGGHAFLNVPSAMICVSITVGLCAATYGWSITYKSLCSIKILFVKLHSCSLDKEMIHPLRSLIIYSYVSGISGWLIGNIQMLSNVSEFDTTLMMGEAVCLVTIFYSFLFSEYLLRPTAKRLEQLSRNNA
ncbi:MAG: hypothetical protein EOM12_08035 [Verrucomicrobiae bacterium]|nr:hypothetical protein [Verrucomicrobiae bacterium]